MDLVAALLRRLDPVPASCVPLHAAGVRVGLLKPEFVQRLRAWVDVFEFLPSRIVLRPELADTLARSGALERVARALAAEGLLSAWRDETYAVGGVAGEPPLFHLERAAARYFGIRTHAVHANGVVTERRPEAMWIARRAVSKAIDPGQLDNLVGGGLASGSSVAATLVKEAREEAGLTERIARAARPAGLVHILRSVPDGIQDETIFVHDVELPAHFVPANEDGEVADFRLAPCAEVLGWIAAGELTFDASLVAVDCLIRRGHLRPDRVDYCALVALLRRGLDRPALGTP